MNIFLSFFKIKEFIVLLQEFLSYFANEDSAALTTGLHLVGNYHILAKDIITDNICTNNSSNDLALF